jgi:hypothetical protein
MELIDLDDILLRHYIKFDYDVSKSLGKDGLHHLFKIEDSIHYKSLINDDYSVYETLITTTKQKEHSKDKFLELKEEFDYNLLKENKINILWSNEFKKYTVQDGCHRMALIKFNNLDDNGKIPKEWFNIRMK